MLQEEIEHHVKEEEKREEGLFAQARKAGIDMDALGEQLAARKQELTRDVRDSGLPKPELTTMDEVDGLSALSRSAASRDKRPDELRPDITAFFDEATNSVSYLVADPASRAAAVIDPVLDFDLASGVLSTSRQTRFWPLPRSKA